MSDIGSSTIAGFTFVEKRGGKNGRKTLKNKHIFGVQKLRVGDKMLVKYDVM